MKKVLSFLLALICLNTFAQNTSPQTHLKFMGIEINGSVATFASRLMTEKQFVLVKKQPAKYQLKGIFGGKKCEIMITGSSISDLVNAVLVKFQPAANEITLLSNYNDLKFQLTEKYGTPKSENETSTLFLTEEGDILVSFNCDELNLSLFYSDKINTEKEYKEQQEKEESALKAQKEKDKEQNEKMKNDL